MMLEENDSSVGRQGSNTVWLLDINVKDGSVYYRKLNSRSISSFCYFYRKDLRDANKECRAIRYLRR